MPECRYRMNRNLLRQMLRIPDELLVEKIVLSEDDPTVMIVHISGDSVPEGEAIPTVYLRTDPVTELPVEYVWVFTPTEQSEDKDAS